MSKSNRSVVRNAAHSRATVPHMERHNERKNEHYGNGDVMLARSEMNVCFKQCTDGYLQTFDGLIESGAISTRGLKADAKIMDEMIFDVNTAYFDERGGYDYAKSFFEEAYRMAVKEIGNEDYILSAVMHADERNKALSEQLGRDVFHYHLHVVYIPIVEKEVLWTKRCKDPTLVGTVKERIKQVSNSKKWESKRVRGKDGKERLVYSYSLLQDRFYEHMKSAGFEGFERGERGSMSEHLDVLDYKIKQDTKRAAMLENVIEVRQNAVTTLEESTAKKQARLSGLDEDLAKKQQTVTNLDAAITSKQQTASALNERHTKIQEQINALTKRLTIVKGDAATVQEIDSMTKKTMFGKIELAPDDWERVSNLAKEGILSRTTIPKLKEQLTRVKRDVEIYKSRWEKLWHETQEFREALRLFPQRVKVFLAELFAGGREEPTRTMRDDKRIDR